MRAPATMVRLGYALAPIVCSVTAHRAADVGRSPLHWRRSPERCCERANGLRRPRAGIAPAPPIGGAHGMRAGAGALIGATGDLLGRNERGERRCRRRHAMMRQPPRDGAGSSRDGASALREGARSRCDGASGSRGGGDGLRACGGLGSRRCRSRAAMLHLVESPVLLGRALVQVGLTTEPIDSAAGQADSTARQPVSAFHRRRCPYLLERNEQAKSQEGILPSRSRWGTA